MAENTTSITVKVEADLGGLKERIKDAVSEALTEVFQSLVIEPSEILVTPVAEALKVGDRVKLVGNRRISGDTPDADWSHWAIELGDIGEIEDIDDDGDADVRFDTGAYYVALTSLEKIQPEPALQVETLADADRTQKYTDVSGDIWEYSGYYNQWEYKDQCPNPCTGSEHEFGGTDQFGPFELVAE